MGIINTSASLVSTLVIFFGVQALGSMTLHSDLNYSQISKTYFTFNDSRFMLKINSSLL